MYVVFDHKSSESENITTFYFKPAKAVEYTAGQFIELTIPHRNPDDRGDRRWFTLSSSPTDELLSITTKLTKAKGSTFKKALNRLAPGSELYMSDPMGDFVLPKLLQTPLIFVAGGIGITPVHSILKWLTATAEHRDIKVIYAVRVEDEIIFQETFEAAKQHVTVVVGNPSDAWGGEHGELSAELILGLEKPSDDTLIYLSGPEQMVEKLTKDLRRQGIAERQLVGDFFPGYQVI